MVISFPHNLDKFFKLTYTHPCHYDPYYNKIVEWLEDSYNKNIQGNGKIMLTLLLNDDYEGKCDIFLSFFDILPFLLVMFDFVSIAGLELLNGYIGSMTSHSILICLVVRVGLRVGFCLVLFLTIYLCNNAVMSASRAHQENHNMIIVREVCMILFSLLFVEYFFSKPQYYYENFKWKVKR
jgi:hypothetical protein